MIGSTDFPINTLVLQGAGNTCVLDVTVPSPSCSSDESLKTNVSDLPSNVLDTLTKVRTVSYNWKNFPDASQSIGFLAQDLKRYFPQVVSEAPNGLLTVSYGGMTPILTQAIRELNIKITDIQNFRAASNQSFVQGMIGWMGDQANGITHFVAGLIEGKTIKAQEKFCVGDRCITEEQFNQLLNQNNIAGGSEYQGQLPSPAPVVEEQSTPDTSVDSETPVFEPETVEESSPETPVQEPIDVSDASSATVEPVQN